MNAIVRVKFYLLWDLISGFWQIKIEEENKPKTVFSTLWEYYEYNIILFGFKRVLVTF